MLIEPRMRLFPKLKNRLIVWRDERLNRNRIARLARQVSTHAPQPAAGQRPLLSFNVSTRLTGLSLNAAFQMLTGWSLRLAGVPVIHFVCDSGLRPCILGTNRQQPSTPPPCESCLAQSRRLVAGAQVSRWTYRPNPALSKVLESLDIHELSEFIDPQPFVPYSQERLPLGKLTLPSIRWALRRHTLQDDEPTRYLLRQYMLSAESLARHFAAVIEREQPQAAIIFNGMMYPEAAARWVARQMDLPNVAHEVGFQRFSAFFTTGEPTAYPIHIPDDFELTPEQNQRLDRYLEQRFQGKFSMAGIQFWPEMRGLDAAFLERIDKYRQLVPVFTNVIYDTSQVHANVVFPHMFAWLDCVAGAIRRHPETLFVLRAHPDELRPGTKKLSNETVRDWVAENGLRDLPNAIFIDSQEYLSSYELIQRSKFVVVYNSSIGLEAALMGKPVLCGGKARYTQYPIVFFPSKPRDFEGRLEDFLEADQVTIPEQFQRNARRFLYYQLYRTSLPMDDYMQTGHRPGFVLLRDFEWQQLLADQSPTMQVIQDGILNGDPFLVRE
jgi:hypothetical protein